MSERMGMGKTENTELPNALNSIPTSIKLKSLANPCIAKLYSFCLDKVFYTSGTRRRYVQTNCIYIMLSHD